jgi:hypothetical protein
MTWRELWHRISDKPSWRVIYPRGVSIRMRRRLAKDYAEIFSEDNQTAHPKPLPIKFDPKPRERKLRNKLTLI